MDRHLAHRTARMPIRNGIDEDDFYCIAAWSAQRHTHRDGARVRKKKPCRAVDSARGEAYPSRAFRSPSVTTEQ